MRRLSNAWLWPVLRPAALALCAVILVGGLAVAGARPATAAVGGSGACNPYVDGTVVQVPCESVARVGGNAGTSATSASSNACRTIVFSLAKALSLGLSAPPAGEAWAVVVCADRSIAIDSTFLVSTLAGQPQVTPQQLVNQALGELRVPSLRPATAPPDGADGLVGLPEWFWVPAASWRPLSVTVSVGSVWATVTATPVGLTFDPGVGLAPVSCPGPGTAYDADKPAAAQRTACSYTYGQPSAGLPGNVYPASLTVSWHVTWTGSGGAGGVLADALSVPAAVTIPVAQGEALVTSP